jgi:hypothetical protein
MEYSKVKAKTFWLFLIFLTFFICLVSKSQAATYYMPDDFANLHMAFSEMAGGDTLIIRDGTYTGGANCITNSHKPPNGSAGAYTVVRAENDGQVLIDGEGSNQIFSASLNYVEFRGIKWGRSTDGIVQLRNGSDHVKFIRCGAYEMANVTCAIWSIGYCSYVLLEECYAWGNARYSFMFYQSHHCIARKCVARLDRANRGSEPAGIFRNYSSPSFLLME